MKTFVYSVLDAKAGVYGTPFFMQQKAMAIRAFRDLAIDEKTLVGKHPEDFSLWEVGSFDDEKAVIEGCTPSILCHASSFHPSNGIFEKVKKPLMIDNIVEVNSKEK